MVKSSDASDTQLVSSSESEKNKQKETHKKGEGGSIGRNPDLTSRQAPCCRIQFENNSGPIRFSLLVGDVCIYVGSANRTDENRARTWHNALASPTPTPTPTSKPTSPHPRTREQGFRGPGFCSSNGKIPEDTQTDAVWVSRLPFSSLCTVSQSTHLRLPETRVCITDDHGVEKKNEGFVRCIPRDKQKKKGLIRTKKPISPALLENHRVVKCRTLRSAHHRFLLSVGLHGKLELGDK
ncbi:hypothetical protein F5I97DRAFT_1991279 [Phlebopus sp. FC_14]|nr:hypothetical protein F5I97DRAFT_1991279 [Phlebopus sp. FC_14]